MLARCCAYSVGPTMGKATKLSKKQSKRFKSRLIILFFFCVCFYGTCSFFLTNQALHLEQNLEGAQATSGVVVANQASLDTPPYEIPTSSKSRTHIVGFCNAHFRFVGVAWYERMSRLGYDNHILVATDPPMAQYLRQNHKFRYHTWFHEDFPPQVKTWPRAKQDHAYLELLMAVRWKYLQRRLEEGTPIVLTDVDNIFTRYLDVDADIAQKDSSIDVWHAYATKFPRKAFSRQGFVVCSGMSWWRPSPGGIAFARLMQSTCGDMCDDQRVLNDLMIDSTKLNMTWMWTEKVRRTVIDNTTTSDPRFLGLPTIGVKGVASQTGHRAQVWDRDFALRGPLNPEPCPPKRINWVSMPILEAKNRQEAWKAKLDSFQQWDENCA